LGARQRGTGLNASFALQALRNRNSAFPTRDCESIIVTLQKYPISAFATALRRSLPDSLCLAVGFFVSTFSEYFTESFQQITVHMSINVFITVFHSYPRFLPADRQIEGLFISLILISRSGW
jgi:hypothetical protein